MTAFFSRYRNAITGAAFALLGAGTFWAVSSLPFDRPPATDPALFPRAIAAGLIVVGAVLVFSTLIGRGLGLETRKDDAEGVPIDVEIPEELLAEHGEEEVDWKLGLSFGLAIAIYCFTAFTIGFITMTIAFVAVVAMLLGHARSWRGIAGLVVFTILIAAAYYVGFFYLLQVRLPRTLLP